MRDGFMVHGVEGALGGAIGTLLAKKSAMLAQRLPLRFTPTDTRADPGDFVLSRLEGLFRRALSRRVHDRIVAGLPWAYGIAWGSLLGIAVAGLRVHTARKTLLAGAGMGALVWAVGYAGWLPRAGLTRPVLRQGAGHVTTSLLTHVLFGVAAAWPIAFVDQARRRRRPWWQRIFD